LKLTTNPVRIVLRRKKERDDRRQEERYGSRKEWNQHRRKREMKAFIGMLKQ
jgi:hypothetical protein